MRNQDVYIFALIDNFRYKYCKANSTNLYNDDKVLRR